MAYNEAAIASYPYECQHQKGNPILDSNADSNLVG